MPHKPATPILIEQTPDKIDIQWTLPADGGSSITDFVIYTDGGTGSFSPLTPTAGSGSTLTYSITENGHGISDGVNYGIRVAAVNDVGEGQPSETVYIIAAQIPDAPVDLIATAASDVSITIEWTDPAFNGGSDVTDFKVYWNEGVDDGPFLPLSDTTFGYNTYTK